MTARKRDPLTLFHLASMAILALTNIASAIVFISSATPAMAAEYNTSVLAIASYGCLNIINTLALICGIAYLLQGYSKESGYLYHGFMLLTAIACVCTTVGVILAQGFGFSVIVLIAKIFILFALAYGKDLGERNTWTLFSVLVALDVLLVILFGSGGVLIYRIVTTLTRLFIDSTIGLAILGKYRDKAARGTV